MLKSVFSACVFRSDGDMEQRSIAERYCLRELCVTTSGATGDLLVRPLSGFVLHLSITITALLYNVVKFVSRFV